MYVVPVITQHNGMAFRLVVSRHERIPTKFWMSDSDSPPSNPAFQGTGTGSTGNPGTRVPGQHIVPFTVVKRAWQVDDRGYFDCISLRELQALNGTSLYILTQDSPSALG